jgi:hypothetical protein
VKSQQPAPEKATVLIPIGSGLEDEKNVFLDRGFLLLMKKAPVFILRG